MLKKLFESKTKKNPKIPFLVEAGGAVSVHVMEEIFWIGDQPLRPLSKELHILEPFLQERRDRNEPLEAHRVADRLEITLQREDPSRCYRLSVHPLRCTIAWSEELSDEVDPRIPPLEPIWNRNIGHPPWPPRAGRTTISAAWLPDGVLLLLGDWVTWMDPDTGRVLGEWPLPGKKGTRAAVELLAVTPLGILGTYRAFHETLPPVAGMLIMKFDGQPRWKLFSTKNSVSVDEPLVSTPGQLVVEGRVTSEDNKVSRAQWVIDMEGNRAYTAIVGGPPEDADVERCLALGPVPPNALEFVPVGEQMIGTHPCHKLTRRLVMPTPPDPESVLKGVLWKGRALAYQLRHDSLKLYAWEAEDLAVASCPSCHRPVALRAYHCSCGHPWTPA